MAGAGYLSETRRKAGPCPQEPAGTLKLRFSHAWEGDFVRGIKVMVGTDGCSYSGLLKRHQKEKDTAAIQSPLNIGPFQYLVRAAVGNVGSRQPKVAEPPTPLVCSTDTNQFSNSAFR